jgi:hypothetical protein
MFKVSPAILHTFIDTKLTLTPYVIHNSNYVIIVRVLNCLKYFCVFLNCNHQVHRQFLITLYKPQQHSTTAVVTTVSHLHLLRPSVRAHSSLPSQATDGRCLLFFAYVLTPPLTCGYSCAVLAVGSQRTGPYSVSVETGPRLRQGEG